MPFGYIVYFTDIYKSINYFTSLHLINYLKCRDILKLTYKMSQCFIFFTSKPYQGIFNPLKILNTPSTFLKYPNFYQVDSCLTISCLQSEVSQVPLK